MSDVVKFKSTNLPCQCLDFSEGFQDMVQWLAMAWKTLLKFELAHPLFMYLLLGGHMAETLKHDRMELKRPTHQVRSRKQHLRARESKQLVWDTDGSDRFRLIVLPKRLFRTLWHHIQVDTLHNSWIWHVLKLDTHTHTHTHIDMIWNSQCSTHDILWLSTKLTGESHLRTARCGQKRQDRCRRA